MEDKQIRMDVPYFQVPNAVFEVGLDKHEILVYVYLARCGNHGNRAFPSYNTIAKRCGISRRKAIETVQSLEGKGLLKKEVRYDASNEKHYSNVYIVNHDIKGGAGNSLGSAWHAPGGEWAAPNKEISQKERGKEEKNIVLPDDDCFLSIYKEAYRQYKGAEHPPVKRSQLDKILRSIEVLRDNLDLDEEMWSMEVEDHFQNLAPTNDGKIFAFLTVLLRKTKLEGMV